MNFATLAFAVADRVATVTLNRPDKSNALSDEVVDELDRAVDAIRTRNDVAGAIITGAGPKAFVAAVNGFALGGRPAPRHSGHSATEDMREGMRAFLEKRPAQFTGR